MELEVELSSLQITQVKKRRVSGLHGYTKRIEEYDDAQETTEDSAPRRSTRIRKPSPTAAFMQEIIIPIEESSPPLEFERDIEEIKKIYLNKTVKRHNPSLETIFEDPVKDKLMSSRKFRRVITFGCSTAQAQAQKVKKRTLKMTKMSAKARIQKKSSMKMLMKRLSKIEDEEQ